MLGSKSSTEPEGGNFSLAPKRVRPYTLWKFTGERESRLAQSRFHSVRTKNGAVGHPTEAELSYQCVCQA